MTKTVHTIYVSTMSVIVLLVTFYIAFYGFDYYSTPVEARFYHENYDWFKPSGLFGHGLGIIGTAMILFGVVLYIVAKKYRIFEGKIRLKYILEFHIFLCTLGPILILFHTSFKFGGIVSIAFWSMVAVVISGVIGRFIYIQIPRSIEGRELSLQEFKATQSEFIERFNSISINFDVVQETASDKNLYTNFGIMASIKRFMALADVNKKLAAANITSTEKRELIKQIKQQWKINQRVYRMTQMQKLFKHWHIAHRPFALIMLVVVTLHVIVTVALGYTWVW